MKRALTRLYVWLVAHLIRALVTRCLRRGRYVTYVHQGRDYLRRYAVCGWLTGDARAVDAERWHSAGMMPLWRVWWVRLRLSLPNLYVHQMLNPDLDPCLHDHPWPWAVSWVALGGYRETRYAPGSIVSEERNLNAPALNVLRGETFHRIAELRPYHTPNRPTRAVEGCRCGCQWHGTWTIFLAGPRARAKPWGYLVPGSGYVGHRARHEAFGGEEVRGKPIDV